jgi:hypothetical protein
MIADRKKISTRDEALMVLEDALNRCAREDVRKQEVFDALAILEAQASVAWPFEQFSRSLGYAGRLETESEADKIGRWQNLNASLNAIRRAIGAVK